ncbi:PQQ-binding-like beta-propeller repeat protein [Actinoplanes couchii]|uniref:Pyrrolo-quinoline quinone repeat domain-containing protein n=1 Tax=Actinoplanes couchii TaxID=403638 RepID=A0ABQ3XIB5_9ACTN|nr:PQQ-binding-like beta-propeller repeat protein [Actinoplanes couchii]MDR6324685.1 outer membrane protein assembly factor BamB [Actinoplanes couchii]GID58239.1 hypothetical protein Aco03nite_066430 [Actinoplanes couchii]
MPASSLILTAVLALGLWDHPGYDAEDSHYNPHETRVTIATIAKVTRTWQVDLRTSAESCSRFATPVVAGGRIHVSDQLGLSTYDVKTGQPLWRYDWKDADDTGTPRLAVSDGLVIAAGNDCNSQSDPDGYLFAVDARTGLPRWQQSTGSPITSMVVDKGVVAVSGGSASDDNEVTAFATRDGRELWSRPNALTSEVSANGTLLLRTEDTKSSAASILTGKDSWTRDSTWTARAADPHSEWFYATDAAGNLSAIRVSDGAVRWKIPSSKTDTNEMAVDENRIYRASGRNILALNTADGTKAWSRTQSAEATQPTRAGDLLYAGGHPLNPDNGTPTTPDFPGKLLVTNGRIHQLNNGVLTTWSR